MLDSNLILLNIKAERPEDVINTLGKIMLSKTYVKEDYVDSVLERERNLPTGLDTGSVCVAIPHTDSQHVNKSSFGVATLKNPVEFNMMVNPQKKLGVDIVFLLAVKDPNSQVELLKDLMSVFQNQELLKSLKEAESKEEVLKLLSFITV